MKNVRFLALLLLSTIAGTAHCPLSTISAEEAGVHRFATYNVRYVNSNNGDTGDKLWANRRDYVCQIVKDYDFDIVGMQEVTGNNKDPKTGKSQLQDINDRLPGYECIAYERENRQYSYNTILYKSDKYECLDHCSFWLSPKPWSESSSATWVGGDIARRCIVAHMKVKATGEEFYFCCTHCNYAPQQAGIEGARVIHEELPPLVGDLPVVLVGDFNMNREEHTESYRAYASIFKEARVECDSMLSLPTTNPQVKYTNSFNWVVASKHPSGTSEFDHQFYSKMEPLSYHIISEDYGRAVTPSDHYPLLVRYRLLTPSSSPLTATDELSLQSALKKAVHGDTIFLQTDSIALTNPIRPACSICLKGQEGGTILSLSTDGSAIEIPGSWSFIGENLIIKNATNTTLQAGAGIYTKGYDLSLKNCQFIHCEGAKGNGGAVCATSHIIKLNSCTFIDNKAINGGACYLFPYGSLQINDCLWQNNVATGVGGGLYAQFPGDCRVRHCVFDANEAAAGAGLSAETFDVLGILNCSFTRNKGTKQGALWLTSSKSNSKATVFQSTFLNNQLTISGALPTILANYGGAALKIQVPSSDASQAVGLAHCTFINNNIISSVSIDKFISGAVDIKGGYVCMMNNWIFANRFQSNKDEGFYSDVRTSGTINVWRDTYNLLTNDEKVVGWQANIGELLEGQWQDSLFVPTITNQFVYNLLSTSIGSASLCAVPLIQRMCSSALGYDLSEDGMEGNYLRYDQLGHWRDQNACYGSIEYVPSTDLNEIKTDMYSRYNKILQNGQIILEKNHSQYNILGQSL